MSILLILAVPSDLICTLSLYLMHQSPDFLPHHMVHLEPDGPRLSQLVLDCCRGVEGIGITLPQLRRSRQFQVSMCQVQEFCTRLCAELVGEEEEIVETNPAVVVQIKQRIGTAECICEEEEVAEAYPTIAIKVSGQVFRSLFMDNPICVLKNAYIVDCQCLRKNGLSSGGPGQLRSAPEVAVSTSWCR